MADLTPEKRAELRERIGRARVGYMLTVDSVTLLSLLDALEAAERKIASARCCWHCRVAIEPEGLPHCESCPTECDGCDAEGCQEQLTKNDAVCPSNRRKESP